MIASVSSYVIPALLSAGIIWAAYQIGRRSQKVASQDFGDPAKPRAARAAREQRPTAIIAWKTPIEAIEAFGNKFIRDERDRREQEADEISLRGLEADEAIRQINKSYRAGMSPNVPSDVVANYEQWHAKLSAAGFEGDDAKDGLKQANQTLLTQIVQELAQGKLIAKGLRMPRDGLGETTIPQSEWRCLELDQDTEEASHHGTIIFTGVRIGKLEAT